jgi:hypothetical protein
MALRPISRIDDFTFPEGAWDVRGWTVRTEVDEDKVGRVDDMLLNRRGELRYLDVDLGFLKKHVLVPLDRAHADRERETIWIEGLGKDRLKEAPEYALEPEALDEDYERRLGAYFGAPPPVEEHGAPGPAVAASAGRTHAEAPLELERMSEVADDFQVAGDDPRGWKVLTGDGEPVGKVAELLVAPGEMKARFLDVAVDEKGLDLEPVDRHVLLPAERIQLDRKSKNVVVAGLLAHDLADYPQYNGLPVARHHATRIDDFFDRGGADGEAASDPARPREPEHRHAPAVRHFYRRDRPGRDRYAREE